MPSDVTNMDRGSVDNSMNVVNRFWIIDANGYTAKPEVTIVFTYSDEEVSATGNTITESMLQAQRWNSTTSQWNDIAVMGTVSTDVNTVTGVAVDKDNFFRSWVLVGGNTPLPIHLISFEAACNDNQTILTWTTATERNNSHFEIEHSTNIQTWETIKTINGSDNSSTQIDYEYTVENNKTPQEVDYYRLKQVDFDGTSTYSFIVSSSCGNIELEINSVYPNPSTGPISILVNATESINIVLKIYDVLGRVIIDDIITVEKGLNTITKNIQGAAGKYFISAYSSDGRYLDSQAVKIKN